MKNKYPVICFVLSIIAIAAFFFGNFLGLSHDPSMIYESSAKVIEVDQETGWVTLEDWDGEAWCIRNDSFLEGELVILVFNDCNTETIYDDVIVEIHRGDWVAELIP